MLTDIFIKVIKYLRDSFSKVFNTSIVYIVARTKFQLLNIIILKFSFLKTSVKLCFFLLLQFVWNYKNVKKHEKCVILKLDTIRKHGK